MASKGMGAAAAVPTPSTATGKPRRQPEARLLTASTPSVTNNMRPCSKPALSNNSWASSRALSGLLPSTGIMAGLKAVNRFSMVRTSSVSGATTWLSPA